MMYYVTMRCSTICGSTTTQARVLECCCDLKPDIDLSDAMKVASVLFWRLTGRQVKYAGTCVHTVKPCEKGCTCDLEFVKLPGACDIVEVVLDGLVVDPDSYRLSNGLLYNLADEAWPLCQNPKNNADKLKVFTETVTVLGGKTSLIVTPLLSGLFDLTGVVPIFAGSSVVISNAIESIEIPSVCVVANTVNPVLAVTDVDVAAIRLFVKRFTNKTGSFVAPFSFDYTKVFTRNYTDRPLVGVFADPKGTFQIKYKTGCCVPDEVQIAVGALACEIAKARCGDEGCRLPDYLKNVTLDGVDFAVSQATKGLTGLTEVDRLILSINPNGLQRSGRILSIPKKRLFRS